MNSEGDEAAPTYANSILFMVNERSIFASSDGTSRRSGRRIWPIFFLTKVDKATGKFETRNSLALLRWGMGYEYLDARTRTKSRRNYAL